MSTPWKPYLLSLVVVTVPLTTTEGLVAENVEMLPTRQVAVITEAALDSSDEEIPAFLRLEADPQAFQGFHFWPVQSPWGEPKFARADDRVWFAVSDEMASGTKLLQAVGKGNLARPFYVATDYRCSKSQEVLFVYSKSAMARISVILIENGNKPKRIYWDVSDTQRIKRLKSLIVPKGSGRLVLQFLGARPEFVKVHQFRINGQEHNDQPDKADFVEYSLSEVEESIGRHAVIVGGVPKAGEDIEVLDKGMLGSAVQDDAIDAQQQDTNEDFSLTLGARHARDTDQDGVSDQEERLLGTDPLVFDEAITPLTINFKDGDLRGYYFWSAEGPRDRASERSEMTWLPHKLNSGWVLRVTGTEDEQRGSLRWPWAKRPKHKTGRVNQHPLLKYLVTYIVPKSRELLLTYSKSRKAHFTVISLDANGEPTDLFFDRAKRKRDKRTIKVTLLQGPQRLALGFKGTQGQFVDIHAMLIPGVPDSDQDNVADAWEYRYFGTLDQDFLGETEHGNTDTDGDGVTDYLEYQRGTDPLVAKG